MLLKINIFLLSSFFLFVQSVFSQDWQNDQKNGLEPITIDFNPERNYVRSLDYRTYQCVGSDFDHPEISEFINSYKNLYEYSPYIDPQSRWLSCVPKITGALDRFANEHVAVLLRGVNLSTSSFSVEERLRFIKESQVGKDMYCPDAYQTQGIHFSERSDETDIVLQKRAELVASYVNGLGIKRLKLQEYYVNRYKDFMNTFGSNPHLSFSSLDNPHAACFGFGIKNKKGLSPDYDLKGRPRHPVVGKLYAIILNLGAVKKLQPLNNEYCHYNGLYYVSSTWQRNYLSAQESTIAGWVPGEYVVAEVPLCFPSSEIAYQNAAVPKGISKTIYNNRIAKICKNAWFKEPLREEETKLAQTLAGCCTAELSDKIRCELERINATICTIVNPIVEH